MNALMQMKGSEDANATEIALLVAFMDWGASPDALFFYAVF